MAYSTISKSSSYFNTTLWTGDGNSTQNITGTGFNADWIWLKGRSGSGDNQLYDKVRGVQKMIISNGTNAESTNSIGLQTFGSDGFTMGSDMTGNGSTFVSWNWKANGSGSANSDGTISSTVSVDTTSGFSVVKYTGNSSNGATIGHGLGAVPKMIIVKNYDKAESWQVYHTSLGNTSRLFLNTNAAESTGRQEWYSTTPTSSVFYVGTGDQINLSGDNYIAYCFAEKNGFSKFSSFTGNGEPNNDNPFIYTGFKPSFVMLKVTNTTDSWNMYDNRRDGYNGTGGRLRADTNNAEDTGTDYQTCDFYSNGFSPKGNDTTSNGNGKPYIYMAFGQPIVSTNGDIATAR